jgi:TldD protein
VLEKSSVLGDKLGKKVASEHLTLVDTPNVLNEHGHFRYDDEGTPAGETFLINNGVLTTFMNSLESASLMDVNPTGNGRAMDPGHKPIPRMTNTVLKPGQYNKAELFEGIKKGIYAKGSNGGVVEPTNGNFIFNAEEAFLIENGKITKPLRDVSLAGNILEILPKITKIANDDVPNFFGGRCGKGEQWVPVGERTPHILISEAIIGGANS